MREKERIQERETSKYREKIGTRKREEPSIRFAGCAHEIRNTRSRPRLTPCHHCLHSLLRQIDHKHDHSGKIIKKIMK
jgi:hypothetical protein